MRKIAIHLSAIGFILVSVIYFASCSNDNRPINPSIAISMANFHIQRLPHEVSAITRLANEKGMAVVTLNAANDVDRQKQHLSDFIDQKIPVIIVVAVDGKALSSEVDNAHERGLHVIAYDRLIHSANLSAYISFDNIEVGRLQALSVLSVITAGNFVLLGGSPMDNNAHLVRKGQIEVLSPYIDEGQITVVEDVFIPNWEPHLAFLEMERILKKYGNRVDAVVASNDDVALGAIQALKLQGLSGKVPISGQDATPEGCKAIAEGELTATVFKNIHELAPLALEIAEKIIQNKQLNLSMFPLKVLSSNDNSSGYVPCKFLDVSTVDRSNLYEKIILTQIHQWADVYRDLPMEQRPPEPVSDETTPSK